MMIMMCVAAVLFILGWFTRAIYDQACTRTPEQLKLEHHEYRQGLEVCLGLSRFLYLLCIIAGAGSVLYLATR